MKAAWAWLIAITLSNQLAFGMTLTQPTQAEILEGVLVEDVYKALARSGISGFGTGYGNELREAIGYWRGTGEEAVKFANLLKKMAATNSGQLKAMLESGQLKQFALAALDESSVSAFRNLDAKGLEKAVRYGTEGLDAIGAKSLALLDDIDDVIARTGKVPAQLAAELRSTVSQLSPERARALRKLIASDLPTKRAAFGEFIKKNPGAVGAFVDGLFAYLEYRNIAALTDEHEQAARATGAGFGYLFQTAGNAGVAAVGGGFLPGVVVSLSAAQVKELVTEMVLLQRDMENAVEKEKWARLELRRLVIDGMLKVDEKIKLGKLSEALDQLIEIERFTFGKGLPLDGVYETLDVLRGKIDKAGDRMRANRVIAEARIPYMQALRWVQQGRNLTSARRLLEEARKVLEADLERHPELAAQLDQIRRLDELVERRIAEAPPPVMVQIEGPETAAQGESVEFMASLFGGIPDYHPSGMGGLGLGKRVRFFWDAPMEPGVRTVSLRAQDALGRVVEGSTSIEITGEVAAEPPADDTADTVAVVPSPVVAQPRPVPRGHWFASSLPADWQVVRNEKGAWTATVWRVIAAKSGNCPEQGANGSVSVELEGSSSSRDRKELESGLHKLLKSSGWYLEPDAMGAYTLTGPGGEAFAGSILHSKLKYTAGFGSPTVGYRSGRANIGGYVAAIEPDRGRKITAVYSVSAAHCWDNSGADGAKAQAQAMRGQAVQILQNLVLLADKSDSVAVVGPPAGSQGGGVTQPAPVGGGATDPGGQSTPGQGVSVSPPNPQSITVAGDGAQPGDVPQAGPGVQPGAGKAQPTAQPEPSAVTGWHLVDFTFKDGTRKRSSGQFDDIVSHTGGRGDLEITSKRVVRSSGNLIGEVVYRVRWSEPPEVMEAGEQYAIDFELQTLRAEKFKVAQQTIHMNQGHGVYLVAPDGTKYVTTDLKAPFKMEKAVAAGRPGNKRTLQLSFQNGYWALYTYEWKEAAGR